MSYLEEIRSTADEQSSTNVIADSGVFLEACNEYLNNMARWRIPELVEGHRVTLDQAFQASTRNAIRQVMESVVQNIAMYAANAVNASYEERRKAQASLMVIRGKTHGNNGKS